MKLFALCINSQDKDKRDVQRSSMLTFQLTSDEAAPARAPLPDSGSGNTPSSGAWTWSRWPVGWSPRPWWCTETKIKISVKPTTRKTWTQGATSAPCGERQLGMHCFCREKCQKIHTEKNLNAKLLAPGKTCPNWTNLIYIWLASVSKCAVWAIMAHCELWLSSMFDQEHLG